MNANDVISGIILTISNGYANIHSNQIGAAILLAVGLVCCFAGFRLAKFVFAAGGAVLGAALCAYASKAYLPSAFENIGSTIAAVIGAVLVAYLFFHLYKAGVFVCCAAIGAAIGSVPAAAFGTDGGTSKLFLIAVIVCAVLFGVAGLLFLKPVLIAVTGLGGFIAAPQIFMLASLNQSTYLQIIAGAALSVLGIICQILTNKKRSVPGFKPEKQDDFDESAKEPEDYNQYDEAQMPSQQFHEIDETPEVPTMSADGLNELFGKKLWLRFLMKISPVLAIVLSAAAIAIAVIFGSLYLELALIFAFFCYAGKHYKQLSISFALMSIASAAQFITKLMEYSNNMLEKGILMQTIVSAATAAALVLMMISAIVMDRRANPKKVIRRVLSDVQPTSEAQDSLEATRPLTASEVEDAMEQTAVITPSAPEQDDGEKTQILAPEEETQLLDDSQQATQIFDDGQKTEKLDRQDDEAAFAPGTPNDFIKTQKEIFDEAQPKLDDEDMAEEELGDTRTIQ